MHQRIVGVRVDGAEFSSPVSNSLPRMSTPVAVRFERKAQVIDLGRAI
ncbi:MAG: hypothetical protein ABSD49_12760 [Candidatus Bathyarchaeia archaeon]|jgi:hypothetical protein